MEANGIIHQYHNKGFAAHQLYTESEVIIATES